MAVELRELGIQREWDLDEAIGRVKGKPGTHVIVEPADNIGGGGPGDMTHLLRAFLRHDLDGAAVVIADPESVAAMGGAKRGEVRRLRVGGKISALDPGPVELDATFVSASDGKFELEDLHSHAAALGPSKASLLALGSEEGAGAWLAHAFAAGLQVHPYTLRAEFDAQRELPRLLAMGVQGFFIDQPDVGVALRDAPAAQAPRA